MEPNTTLKDVIKHSSEEEKSNSQPKLKPKTRKRTRTRVRRSVNKPSQQKTNSQQNKIDDDNDQENKENSSENKINLRSAFKHKQSLTSQKSNNENEKKTKIQKSVVLGVKFDDSAQIEYFENSAPATERITAEEMAKREPTVSIPEGGFKDEDQEFKYFNQIILKNQTHTSLSSPPLSKGPQPHRAARPLPSKSQKNNQSDDMKLLNFWEMPQTVDTDDLNVTELRRELRTLGMSTKGKKATLKRRLERALQN